MKSSTVRKAFGLLLSDLGIATVEGAFALASRRRCAAIYTAFDGDLFYFTDAMARHVFSTGNIPINPESCLGYKDAVVHLATKENVLRYDVALLGKADEVWVYTDQDPCSPAWSSMAEGVLVEVVWHAIRSAIAGRRNLVSFVDIGRVVAGDHAAPVRVDVSIQDLRSALQDDLPEVLALCEKLAAEEPKKVGVALHALPDAKYDGWLRDWILRLRMAPIVPTLAFDSGDSLQAHWLAQGWIWALENADVIVELDQLNGAPTKFHDFLRSHARSCVGTIIQSGWDEVGAPKAVQGDSWAITDRERGLAPGNIRTPPASELA
ncbi:hypothetical protein G5V59_12860 [Nocardioides sp. W3-2-3]|uniref:hypothetical protein n=1 Tax=Nocardioides convexus TaxID=2712224 RepID=UPI0024185060|nr:hypothetical protein [Nocardioides convexus]NHA00606.1 hypothetical protein [Nocardioides convexus]